MKNLASSSNQSDNGRVAKLEALSLPQIRSLIKSRIDRNGLIHEGSVWHTLIFGIPQND